MKKKCLSILCIILAILLITSCSAKMFDSISNMNGSGSTGAAPPPAAYDNGKMMYEMGMSDGDYAADSYYEPDYDASYNTATQVSDTGSAISVGMQTNMSLAEKIIYTADASVQTTDFDNSINVLKGMITQLNAFVESSYESGADYHSNYYGYNPYRTANYVIRVPSESFTTLYASLTELGHVTYKTSNAANVTEQYTDVESRLKVYRTEESRLLAMLEKCDTVADMITIEATLSNVRYDIESLTSQLKNLDNRVNYSTVTININEVEEITPYVEIHRTYWQQISDGFKNTLDSVGNFFKNLFKFLLTASPVLVILIVIAVVVIILIRSYRKRNKKRMAAVIAQPAQPVAPTVIAEQTPPSQNDENN